MRRKLFRNRNSVAETAFVSTWNTNNIATGSSATNQIALPFPTGGIYNCTVDWGDGNTDLITSYNQAEVYHTYTTAGIKTISITGAIQGFSFGSVSQLRDNKKILSVQSWGQLKLGSQAGYFNQCSNLNLSGVSDVLDLTGVTSGVDFFLNNTSLTSINRSNEWDVSGITLMIRMFQNCLNFSSNISNWNVSNVTHFVGFMSGGVKFNSDVSSWNVSSANDMQNMFYDCHVLNTSFSNWNVSNVTNMIRTLRGCRVIDAASVSNWNVSNVTNMTGFFENLTPTHHPSTVMDAIYNSWSQLILKASVVAGFGTLKYTSAGATGKATLTGTPNNWIITDGGQI